MTIRTAKSGGIEVAPTARSRIGYQIVAFIEALLLAVWLGSMVFFSFAVAPSAFAVLSTRHEAGLLVTSTIMKVEMLGLIIGPLLILIQAASWRARRVSGGSKAIQIILVLVMIAAAAASRFWVSASMSALRSSMGGMIDNVPADDPLRLQFNDLHRYSVALMSVALFAGLAVLFLTVRSWLKR